MWVRLLLRNEWLCFGSPDTPTPAAEEEERHYKEEETVSSSPPLDIFFCLLYPSVSPRNPKCEQLSPHSLLSPSRGGKTPHKKLLEKHHSPLLPPALKPPSPPPPPKKKRRGRRSCSGAAAINQRHPKWLPPPPPPHSCALKLPPPSPPSSLVFLLNFLRLARGERAEKRIPHTPPSHIKEEGKGRNIFLSNCVLLLLVFASAAS